MLLKPPFHNLKFYLDTTIPSFLYALDSPHRMNVTRHFFSVTYELKIKLFVSEIVTGEILRASEPLKTLLLGQVDGFPSINSSSDSENLAHKYIASRILPINSLDDARHIALATLHKMDALISWNFRHMVNPKRIKAIQNLHRKENLPMLEIVTPEEVLRS